MLQLKYFVNTLGSVRKDTLDIPTPLFMTRRAIFGMHVFLLELSATYRRSCCFSRASFSVCVLMSARSVACCRSTICSSRDFPPHHALDKMDS